MSKSIEAKSIEAKSIKTEEKESDMPNDEQKKAYRRWIFVAQALNQSGTLTAAASVFSNRGVSLEGILGSGIDTATAEDGRLLFSFRATEEKMGLLKRSLQRLPSIFKVTAYPYEDERLRAIAIAKLIPTADLKLHSQGLSTETILTEETSVLLFISGKTEAVETAIAHFRSQQQLQDVVMSTITV
ncbi:MAG: hypothetical protein AB8B99_08655 [Phormidesmis sp.]